MPGDVPPGWFFEIPKYGFSNISMSCLDFQILKELKCFSFNPMQSLLSLRRDVSLGNKVVSELRLRNVRSKLLRMHGKTDMLRSGKFRPCHNWLCLSFQRFRFCASMSLAFFCSGSSTSPRKSFEKSFRS